MNAFLRFPHLAIAGASRGLSASGKIGIFLLLAILGLQNPVAAQVPFWSDDFESTNSPSSGTRTPQLEERGGNNEYFGRLSRASGQPTGESGNNPAFVLGNSVSLQNEFTNISNARFWAGENHDDRDVGDGEEELSISWTGINVSDRSNLRFAGLFGAAEDEFENGDYLIVEYRFNGTGSYTAGLRIYPESGSGNRAWKVDTDNNSVGDGETIDRALQQLSFAISGSGNTLDIRIRVSVNSGMEEWAIDNFRLSECTTLTPSITFTESSGATNNDGIVCGSTQVTLGLGTTYTTYAWSTGGTTQTVNVTPSSTTTYTVTVSNAAGCTGTSTATVTVNTNPTVNISVSEASITANDGSICNGVSATLDAGAFSAYSWSPGGSTAQTIQVSPQSTTTYTVTVTDNNGCRATDTQAVTVLATPTITAITATPAGICSGDSSELSVTVSQPTSIQEFEQDHEIDIPNSGNADPFPSILNVSGLPTSGVTVASVYFDDFTHEDPNDVDILLVAPNNQGIWIMSDADGTSNVSNHDYTFADGGEPLPSSASLVDDETYAPGNLGSPVEPTPTGVTLVTSFAEFTGNMNGDWKLYITDDDNDSNDGDLEEWKIRFNVQNFTYNWSNDATTTSTKVGPTNTTTYIVTVTATSGCIAVDSVTVTINDPVCSITGQDSVCANSTGNSYTGGTGSAYSWTISGNGTIDGSATGSTVTVDAGSTGTFTLTLEVTDQGCTTTCTKTITVNERPVASIAGDLDFCSGDSTTLTASGIDQGGNRGVPDPITYLWDNNSTNAERVVSTAGTYAVTVTNQFGCTDVASAVVTVFSLPTAAIAVADTPFCEGDSTTLTASGGTTYAWGDNSTESVLTVYVAGTYNVTVTDENGCTDTESTAVTTFPCISGVVILCSDESGEDSVTINLTGDQTISTSTDADGYYVFEDYVGSNYIVTPVRKDTAAILQGLTVADVLAIQRHCTGNEVITDFCKLVAMDVNRTNSITTLDATLINQALLGNSNARTILKTTGSWKFINTDYTPVAIGPITIDNYNLFNKRILTNITNSAADQDFYAVKTGDVVSSTPGRSAASQPLVWRVQDKILKQGEEFDLVFSAVNFEQIAAFQFALRFDPAALAFQNVTVVPGSVPMELTGNFGVSDAETGMLRVVWAAPAADEFSLPGTAQVFRLRFRALEGGLKVADLLTLDSDALEAVAYDAGLRERSVELLFSGNTSFPGLPVDIRASEPDYGLELLPNRPNPFSNQTTAAFLLPEAGDAQLRVLDAHGRELWRVAKTYPAGYHEEVITLDNTAASGILYLELTTPGAKVSRTVSVLGGR